MVKLNVLIYIIFVIILFSCMDKKKDVQKNYNNRTFAQEFIINSNKSDGDLQKRLIKRYGKLSLYMDSTIILKPEFQRIEVTKYYFNDSSNLIKIINYKKRKDNTVKIVNEFDNDGVLISSRSYKNDSLTSKKTITRNRFKIITEILDIQNNHRNLLKYQYLNDTTFIVENYMNGKLKNKDEIIVTPFLKIKSSKRFNENNELIEKITHKYDEHNNNIYEKFEINGKVDGKTIYKYDSQNRVIEQIDFLKSEDYYSNHEKLKYDKDGNIIYHYEIDRFGDTTITVTRRTGNIIKWEKSRNGKTILYREVRKNKNNKTVYECQQDSLRKYEVFHEYDTENREISVINKVNDKINSTENYVWSVINQDTTVLEMFKDNVKYQISYYVHK